jgi:hypothetical protein
VTAGFWMQGLVEEPSSAFYSLAAETVRFAFFNPEHMRLLLSKMLLLKMPVIDLRMTFDFMKPEFDEAAARLRGQSMQLIYNRMVHEIRAQYVGNRDAFQEIVRLTMHLLRAEPGLLSAYKDMLGLAGITPFSVPIQLGRKRKAALSVVS